MAWNLLWLQGFPCGCKFSHVAASFPMWLQVFNLQDRQDEILSPQERWAASFPMWVQVFNLHLPSTRWRSCRHKRHRHLILHWFRTGGSDLIGRRRGIQRQGETDRQKSLWFDNAARHQNRTVSPDGKPTRARNIPQILLGWLIVSCWATGPRIRHVEKVPPRPSFLTALLSPTEDARRGPALGRGHRSEQPPAPPPSHPPRTTHRRRSGDAGSSPAARSPLSSARA